MPYRLFPRDKQGRLQPGQDFEAPDDKNALVVAHSMLGNGKGEVWQGTRLVAVNP